MSQPRSWVSHVPDDRHQIVKEHDLGQPPTFVPSDETKFDDWTYERPYLGKDLSRPRRGVMAQIWPAVLASIPSDIRKWLPPDLLDKLKASDDGAKLVSQLLQWRPYHLWFLCGPPQFSTKPRDAASCAICIESFDTEKTIVILECGHAYHNSCFSRWWFDELPEDTCPTCRHVLPDRYFVNWDSELQRPESGCFHHVHDKIQDLDGESDEDYEERRTITYFSASYRNNRIDTIEFRGKEYRFQEPSMLVKGHCNDQKGGNDYYYHPLHHWKEHSGCVLENLAEGWSAEDMEDQTFRMALGSGEILLPAPPMNIEARNLGTTETFSYRSWQFPMSFTVSAERRYNQIEYEGDEDKYVREPVNEYDDEESEYEEEGNELAVEGGNGPVTDEGIEPAEGW